MKRDRIKLNNFVIDISSVSSSHTKIYFPGFPGPAAIQPAGRRPTASVLEELTLRSEQNFALAYYKGIPPNSGNFSFLESIKMASEVIDFFLENNQKVHLVGQSWGAVVAIGLFKTRKQELVNTDLFLITPYMFLPEGNHAIQLLNSFLTEFGHLFGDSSLEQLVEEYSEIKVHFNPTEILNRSLDIETIVYIAEKDELISSSKLKKFCEDQGFKSFSSKDSHAFSTGDNFVKLLEKNVFS